MHIPIGYQNGALEEYSDIDILQMIGRAGRPGLDTSGCAAIMTTTDMESKLNGLVSSSVTIESR
jgi:ATP-dependent DNA helicase HFM1/MER3